MDTVRHILQIKGSSFVWTIEPDITVYDALRMMAEKNVGALLVTEHDHLAGIISERDYARKVVLQGRTSRETLVREIMTSTVHTIHPDQTLEEAMDVMINRRVRHLPVYEGDELLGMISIGDVLRAIVHKQRRTIQQMEASLLGKA